MTAEDKYARLLDVLRGLESAVVAFSGGVDSTFLARAAQEALGDRAVLVTADSETYPASELAAGLDRKHWSSTGPIRRIFKDAFAGAGLPYFNPHSFRKTLAQLGEKLCRTPEQFKAWSQNLGHDRVLTTFSSYGEVARERQRDIIRELGQPVDSDRHVQEIIDQLMQAARRPAA